jgi:hypothetical protein
LLKQESKFNAPDVLWCFLDKNQACFSFTKKKRGDFALLGVFWQDKLSKEQLKRDSQNRR